MKRHGGVGRGFGIKILFMTAFADIYLESIFKKNCLYFTGFKRDKSGHTDQFAKWRGPEMFTSVVERK